MSRKDWILIIVPLFFVWLIDHVTKLWGQSLAEPLNYGAISFRLYHNHGAFLGFFSDLPPLLRIVSLSTIGSFLVFSYAVVQYLLPIKSVRLRLGMSILLGGIIGNVYDRIVWGYVVDFLIVDLSFIQFHPMNLADIFQWFGYGLVAWSLIQEDEILWPEQNSRKRLWIYPNYQFRYILFLLIITLSLSLIGTVFSYTYLKVTIFELIGDNSYIPSRFLVPYIFTYLTICSIFCCFLIIIGRKVSHRNAGPIYAFSKYVDDLIEGRNRKFKLRAGDEFKQLEDLGRRLALFLKENDLIDNEDNEKILTTILPNADDLTIAAIPVAEQIPNYQANRTNSFIKTTLNENSEKKLTPKFRECPSCQTSALQAKPSKVAPWLVECQNCQLTYDPREALAPSESAVESELEVPLLNWKKIFKKLLQDQQNLEAFLDIKCGNGESLALARDFGFQVVHGIEANSGKIEQAREMGFEVFEGDLIKNASHLSSYDLIVINQALEISTQPLELLDLCRTLLKPGGQLVIQFANIDSFAARWFRKGWFHLTENQQTCFFSPQTLIPIIENKGFAVVSQESSILTYSILNLSNHLRVHGSPILARLLSLIPGFIARKVKIPLKTGTVQIISRIQEFETAG